MRSSKKILPGRSGSWLGIVVGAAVYFATSTSFNKLHMQPEHTGGDSLDNKDDKSKESLSETEHALNTNAFLPFKLGGYKQSSKKSSLFTFKCGNNQTFGMNPISYILMQLPSTDSNTKEVIRAYTPITDRHTKGRLEIITKLSQEDPMLKFLHNLKIGQEVFIKGPMPLHNYSPNSKKEIGMIAGGVGVTPMLQLIHSVINNPNDNTKLSLLLGAITEQEIAMREYIDQLQKNYPDTLRVAYTLDEPPVGWDGESGYVTAEMIKKYMPSALMGNECMVYVCGPAPMVNLVAGKKDSYFEQGELGGLLKTLGYSQDSVFKL